jgi:hypothetical protein
MDPAFLRMITDLKIPEEFSKFLVDQEIMTMQGYALLAPKEEQVGQYNCACQNFRRGLRKIEYGGQRYYALAGLQSGDG